MKSNGLSSHPEDTADGFLRAGGDHHEVFVSSGPSQVLCDAGWGGWAAAGVCLLSRAYLHWTIPHCNATVSLCRSAVRKLSVNED